MRFVCIMYTSNLFLFHNTNNPSCLLHPIKAQTLPNQSTRKKRMGEEEESGAYRIEYLDGEEGESYNWVKRAGKARITYADGSTFEGKPF